jgi:hypothetical protein
MKNEIKKGLLVGCAGMGLLAFTLATSPARAAEPSSNPMAPTAGGEVPQPKAEKTQIQHESVVVTAVDKSARKLTVKMPSGEKAEIKVSADVKEFDKVKAGDKIDIDYMQSVALGFLPPGTKPSLSEVSASGPGMAGRQISVSAEVIKVDPATNQVTFKGPKGTHRIVTVQDPDLQAKLPNLKPGQVVVLQYTEAVATAIQLPPSQ